MNEMLIIDKLKKLLPIWKNQKAAKEEAPLKNGSDINAMAKRKAEGKIITPAGLNVRRNYY